MIKKEKFKRSFGGKIDGFDNNHEKNYEKAHLKAYLNGNTRFCYGQVDSRGDKIYNRVQEILTPND